MNRTQFTTADGTVLSLLEGGSGKPLIMIPGWSQTAATFKHQFDALSAIAHVVAVDMRGHGESPAVEHGYRIYRLAADIHELIHDRGWSAPQMLGHSMGCSVIWAFLDLYGRNHAPSRIVLVDQAVSVVAKPGWSDEDNIRAGVLFPDHEAFSGFVQAVRATADTAGTKEILRGMFTADIPDAELDWIAAENLKFPRAHAADLLHDHCLIDWTDAIARIPSPTLVIGGEASIFSAQSQRWIAETCPDGRAVIFPADAGGSHFMFYENPERFNAEVVSFLGA